VFRQWVLVSAITVLAVSLAAFSGDRETPEGAVDEPPESSSTSTPTPTESAEPTSTLQAQTAVIVGDVLAMLDGTSAKCNRRDRMMGIAVGDQLELLDATDTTVGLAELEDASDAGLAEPPKHTCLWVATFTEVPTGGQFYKARLGKWTSESVAEEDLATQRLIISPDQ
jgi:hypothetical protein